MMKIKVYCIGKLKEKYFVDAQNEYLKRLERFAKVEVVEINDLPIPLNSSSKEEEIVKDKEKNEEKRKIQRKELRQKRE